MTKVNKYKSTIGSYKKLGKDYLKSIEKLTPAQFYIFIKKLNRGGKVLDVGCAGGRDSKKFIENGFNIIGIDLVEEFLREARKYVPQARFCKMDLLKMNFPKNYFDGIWASAVLLHIKRKDVFKALKGFCNVLKKGGKIFIGIKMGKGSSYSVDKLSNRKRLMVLFSENEIKELLRGVGLNIVYFKILPDDAGRKDIKWIRLIAEKPG
ncbi:MAG: type 11 methyltransferase [Parcubacteria group bacterium LiPW_39]|nr:MAG: type 11 methyltransferase [Parcubacteria group bacterium LiPW_39]